MQLNKATKPNQFIQTVDYNYVWTQELSNQQQFSQTCSTGNMNLVFTQTHR